MNRELIFGKTSADNGLFFNLFYFILDADDYFEINPTTAEITLVNAAISRGNRYTLLVKVSLPLLHFLISINNLRGIILLYLFAGTAYRYRKISLFHVNA